MKISFPLISLSTQIEGYTGTDGLYAWTQPVLNDVKRLIKYFEPLELTVETMLDIHCTIMYSKTAPKPDLLASVQKDFFAKVRAKELCWWEGHDKAGYVVLKLYPKNLQPLHDKWKSCGAVPTYSPYEPHITLKNGCSLDDGLKKFIADTNATLKRIPLTITMTHEQISDCA